jgi:hypothetical protein
MTKEERLSALHEEYELKAQELRAGKVTVSHDDFKDKEVKFLRIEIGAEKDLSKAFAWLTSAFSENASDTIDGTGVFNVMFCADKVSEYDNSDEAKKERAERREKQDALNVEFEAKARAIVEGPKDSCEEVEGKAECH